MTTPSPHGEVRPGTSRVLLRQGVAYGLVGGLQLLIDWGCFVALSSFGLATVFANMAGRVLGAVVGFSLNGLLTFRSDGEIRLGWNRFGRFLLSWGVMSLLSTFAVFCVERGAGLHWAWVLKPTVDIALAGLGFIASRYWIYR